MRLIFLISAAFLSLPLLSMPTAAELEKVKPLVQDLMKSDLDAMKAGKKSRADVAKSAMSLYPQAESQAAKLLLARSAFNLYVKAGEYEAAEKALDALLSAVPDYPALEQAELLEKALYPIPYKSAPNLRARLAAIKDKAQAAGQLKSLLSGFDALAEGPKRKAAATRIATSYVSLGDWPNAVKYFALSDSPAAAAAEAELKLNDEPEASRPYDKAANDWWSIELPKRDSKLALSFRAHSAELYAKALPSLTGLAKVQADRRIKEYESGLQKDAPEPPKNESKKEHDYYIETQGGCFFVIDGITFVPATDLLEIDFMQSVNSVFALGGSTFGVTDSGPGAGIRWGSTTKQLIPNSSRNVRHRLTISPDGLRCDNTKMRLLTSPDLVKSKQSSLYVWAWNQTGGDCQAQGGRIYSIKIMRNGKVVLDLQPVNVPRIGLIDKVTRRQFYPIRGNAVYGESNKGR